MFSLSNRTLIGRLLLEQKSKKKLTYKMMAARLCLVADAQGYVHWETVFQCKPRRKTEGKLISISQIIVFHFL